MSLVDYASSDEEDDLQPSEPPSTAIAAAEDRDDSRRKQPSTFTSSPPSSSQDTAHDKVCLADTVLFSSPGTSMDESENLNCYCWNSCWHKSTRSSSNQQSEDVSPLLPPPIERLPDASLLLNSPILSQPVGTDHSSRVAAAMAENASRKREANGSSSSNIRGKIPRGNLPHSKNIPDTGSGQLVPPQLRGRSNVVTEDISKLFVRRDPQGKS
ncbi:hypothetical protein Cgig2_008662 [Carnegiea gigantea]|uniref:Uncharacterized protein n=1 Tax=Carnegiea gigantea TaxID=171969 RepID=A0A9Q1GQU0_9CARY|nr:hypothetical protein Cgig2_008662 [Carnegiea gigantea]